MRQMTDFVARAFIALATLVALGAHDRSSAANATTAQAVPLRSCAPDSGQPAGPCAARLPCRKIARSKAVVRLRSTSSFCPRDRVTVTTIQSSDQRAGQGSDRRGWRSAIRDSTTRAWRSSASVVMNRTSAQSP
jgi:hypothetical protein